MDGIFVKKIPLECKFCGKSVKTMQDNDEKWKSILDNLKVLEEPGDRKWCITEGDFDKCVPDQLETNDGSPPYICQKMKKVTKGSYGEVVIYSRQVPDEQKIAIKVMESKYDECQATSSYYEEKKSEEKTWCPHVLVQKCISKEGGFKCDLRDIHVKVLAMEVMHQTAYDFLKKETTTYDMKKTILSQIYESLMCLWNNGGVYMDMKSRNVMVNQDLQDNLLVKLVDLGSICKGSQVEEGGVCTYPPPETWPIFNNGEDIDATKCPCTEKTLIWQFAIASLFVYAHGYYRNKNGWVKLAWNSPVVNNSIWLKQINTLMEECRSQLPDIPILAKVRQCFADFTNVNDWRLADKKIPFKFSEMISHPIVFSPRSVVEEKVKQKNVHSGNLKIRDFLSLQNETEYV